MREYLSVSQIGMYQRCPRQYAFRYIEDIKIPPRGVMIQGKAYHEALAANFRHRIDFCVELPLEQVIDWFSDAFDLQQYEKATTDEEEKWEFDQVDWGDDDPGDLKDQGIVLTRLYVTKVADGVIPLRVEEREQIDIDGVPFVMVKDLETVEQVIDHKLKARRFSQADLNNELQPLAYTFENDKEFAYHVALKQKTPVIETPLQDERLCTRPTVKDHEWFTRIVAETWSAIQAGIFPVRPNGWHCSRDYCGYWGMCRGKYQ